MKVSTLQSGSDQFQDAKVRRSGLQDFHSHMNLASWNTSIFRLLSLYGLTVKHAFFLVILAVRLEYWSKLMLNIDFNGYLLSSSQR